MSHTALKYEVEVKDDGRLELRVPLPSGSHVTVFVVTDGDDPQQDLVGAAMSSLDFWDNPLDDEDWNDD